MWACECDRSQTNESVRHVKRTLVFKHCWNKCDFFCVGRVGVASISGQVSKCFREFSCGLVFVPLVSLQHLLSLSALRFYFINSSALFAHVAETQLCDGEKCTPDAPDKRIQV